MLAEGGGHQNSKVRIRFRRKHGYRQKEPKVHVLKPKAEIKLLPLLLSGEHCSQPMLHTPTPQSAPAAEAAGAMTSHAAHPL